MCKSRVVNVNCTNRMKHLRHSEIHSTEGNEFVYFLFFKHDVKEGTRDAGMCHSGKEETLEKLAEIYVTTNLCFVLVISRCNL